MESADIDEPDGPGPAPGGGEGDEEEEEDMVTLDAQRIFLLMRKEYRCLYQSS